MSFVHLFETLLFEKSSDFKKYNMKLGFFFLKEFFKEKVECLVKAVKKIIFLFLEDY